MEADTPSLAASILRCFRVIMHHGRDEGFKIDNFDKLGLHSGGGDGEPWEDYEISAYCDEARRRGRQSMVLAASLAVCLGQREGDVLALPRSAYDRATNTITVRQNKTKKHRSAKPLPIRVLPELRREIEMTPVRSTIFVISEITNRPYSATTLKRVHREICRGAGIADKRLFMHFRHTAATRLGDAGCTEDEIRAVTGHQSDAIRRYVKSTGTMAGAAIEKLMDHRSKQ